MKYRVCFYKHRYYAKNLKHVLTQMQDAESNILHDIILHFYEIHSMKMKSRNSDTVVT